MLWGWSFATWEIVVKVSLWVAAGAGVVAAVSAFAAGYIAYELSDAVQLESNQKIAEANARASEASLRAAEANLELERLKAPRTLNPIRQALVTRSVKLFAGQRYRAAISQGADDGVAFWESLYVALDKAGWVYLQAGAPSIGQPPAGVPIAAIPGVEIRMDPSKEKDVGKVALELGEALHADGTLVAVNREMESRADEHERDVLMIVIGTRVPRQ